MGPFSGVNWDIFVQMDFGTRYVRHSGNSCPARPRGRCRSRRSETAPSSGHRRRNGTARRRTRRTAWRTRGTGRRPAGGPGTRRRPPPAPAFCPSGGRPSGRRSRRTAPRCGSAGRSKRRRSRALPSVRGARSISLSMQQLQGQTGPGADIKNVRSKLKRRDQFMI